MQPGEEGKRKNLSIHRRVLCDFENRKMMKVVRNKNIWGKWNLTTILWIKVGSGPHICEDTKGQTHIGIILVHGYHSSVLQLHWLEPKSLPWLSLHTRFSRGYGAEDSLPNHVFLVCIHQHTLEFPRELSCLTWGWGLHLFLILCCELWTVMNFSFYGVSWSHGRGKHTPVWLTLNYTFSKL